MSIRALSVLAMNRPLNEAQKSVLARVAAGSQGIHHRKRQDLGRSLEVMRPAAGAPIWRRLDGRCHPRGFPPPPARGLPDDVRSDSPRSART